jgi:DivIVA domain-containing protein
MDVTPQELRDIEIRESFRGYHRDDVDELLERAAATIEHLEHQIRILQDRLAAGPAPAPAPRREPERAPAPVPAPVAAPAPVPVPDNDVIQRTLILAQRAADEAVAEAQARAAQLTGEAEARAQAMVSEAESTARRIAETERRRIETEIAQLSATRDALDADVDALDTFASEYRDRIRRAIEAELLHLSAASAGTESFPPRPLLQSEGLVLPAVASAAPAPAALVPAPAPDAAPEPFPAAAEPEPTAPVPVVTAAEPEAEPTWSAAPEAAWSPEPAGGWADTPAADDWSGGRAETDTGAAPAEEWSSESLDDDAFFASLRDAVRDDEPLGPRDQWDDEVDDTDAGRKLFRRRR